ncbi:TPA: hypothetical protein ACHTCR_005494 [Pseudomonas putida]|nr:hypothetical protein EFJ98_24720 [Pseudomonas putida]
MTNPFAIRQEFEAWAADKWNSQVASIEAVRYEGGYSIKEINAAWSAWIDSREAVTVKLPVNHLLPSHQIIRACKSAIEAQGLKVAP